MVSSPGPLSSLFSLVSVSFLLAACCSSARKPPATGGPGGPVHSKAQGNHADGPELHKAKSVVQHTMAALAHYRLEHDDACPSGVHALVKEGFLAKLPVEIPRI